MTDPAGAPPVGITRRALTTAAAWSVPVVGLALAAPHAAATGAPVAGLTLTGTPAFPGQNLIVNGQFAPGFGTDPAPLSWVATGAATGSGILAYNGSGSFSFPVPAGPTPGNALIAVTIGAETSYVSIEVLGSDEFDVFIFFGGSTAGPVGPSYLSIYSNVDEVPVPAGYVITFTWNTDDYLLEITPDANFIIGGVPGAVTVELAVAADAFTGLTMGLSYAPVIGADPDSYPLTATGEADRDDFPTATANVTVS